jgi:hypothetical protein
VLLVTTGTTNLFDVRPNGNVYAAGAFNSGGADLAEMYPARAEVEAGDVVAMDADGRLARADRRQRIFGVVSTSPGSVLGWDSSRAGMPGQRPVALSGRTPVKAVLENGPIRRGDLLAASSKPGYAMKADGDAPAIGTALEDFDAAKGQVLCFVGVENSATNSKIKTLERENSQLRQEVEALRVLIEEKK